MSLTRGEHFQAALNRLAGTYKELPGIRAWLWAFARQAAELDATFADLQAERDLDSAEGAQLDGLGRLLDEVRGGLDDDTYRAKLQLKVIRLYSEGTAANLLQIFKLVTNAEQVELVEVFPAEVQMVAVEPDSVFTDAKIVEAMGQARAAGVTLENLAHTNGLPAFATAEYSGPVSVAGLSTLADPTSGGTLTTLY